MFFKLKILVALLKLRQSRKRFSVANGEVQRSRWKELERVLRGSNFYKEFVLKHAALSEYPLVNKKVFMQQFNSINTCGIDKHEAMKVATAAEQSRDFSATLNGVTVGLSSGTSGNRGLFLASERERAFWVAGILDRVIGFSFKKRKVAFFLRANSNLYGSVQSRLLQFRFFDLLDDMNNHITAMNELNPHILVAQPSVLMELARRKISGELLIQPSKIISVAEVLYSEDKEFLTNVFGQTIHQVYQCTEGFLASTCKFGTLHFNEDFLIIEKKYIDEEKVRFHPVITDLLRYSQPVIRYELNDIIHEMEKCKCGSRMIAIEKIEGRSDDVLKFRNAMSQIVDIYPDFIRRSVMLSDEAITEYQVVQRTANDIALYTNGNEVQFSRAKEAITTFLKLKHIHGIAIHQLNQTVHVTGNKFRRIINDYRETN